jgi:hypothetical protein
MPSFHSITAFNRRMNGQWLVLFKHVPCHKRYIRKGEQIQRRAESVSGTSAHERPPCACIQSLSTEGGRCLFDFCIFLQRCINFDKICRDGAPLRVGNLQYCETVQHNPLY